MDIISLLWLSLTIFLILISIVPIKTYLKDKDKRKLMYGLGLIFCSISFLILGLGYVKYGNYNFFANLLYHWGGSAYLILLFHMMLERLLKKSNKINIIFNSFLFTSFIIFVLIFLNILSGASYGIFMGIGTFIIITLTIGLVVKYKSITNYLFLFSIISSLIASLNISNITINNTTNFFSIYAYYVSFIFLGLIFFYSPKESTDQKGIGTYFSIEKKLKATNEELFQTKQTVQNLFNEMIEPAVIINKKGKILEASNKVFEETGLKRDDVVGKSFLSMKLLDGKTKRMLVKKMIQRFAGKKIPAYEINMKSKDGKLVPYEIHAGKIKYNGKLAEMAIFRNLTEQKKAENEIKKINKKLIELNMNLEKKVEERTFEIKRLLKQKDEFINQLGHDLKNPLNPLVNILPILEKTEKDLEMKKMLSVVNRNVGYMKNLVVKTIELARLNSQSTKFNIKDTNLLSELKSIIETNKFMFEEKDIQIINNVSEDIQISVDNLRLDELFNNLLNNSVKYSDGKGIITINAKPDESFVTVSVSDTGIGMTREQLGNVFDEFYKADESRHDFDSSGLGMSICKRIVERHGGRIWVESKGPGKGSTFYFTLPRSSITNIEKPEKESVKEKKYDRNTYHQTISKKVDRLLERRNMV